MFTIKYKEDNWNTFRSLLNQKISEIRYNEQFPFQVKKLKGYDFSFLVKFEFVILDGSPIHYTGWAKSPLQILIIN